jgi:hypothetical protein
VLLAAILAAEITGIAIARSIVTADAPAHVAVAPITAPSTTRGERPDATLAAQLGAIDGSNDSLRDPRAIRASLQSRRPAAAAPVARPPVAPKPARVKPTAHARPTTPKPRPAPQYAGRNHVWIPSLGISRSVSSFSCTRSQPPDNYVYRWGCAGANNVYLLGHAYSVFKPLHDAYVGGRLHKGITAIYADGSGHVHTYAVAWWRVVAPTTAASWAWAGESRPSMTLQTCVGANSAYRLMVRLIQVR